MFVSKNAKGIIKVFYGSTINVSLSKKIPFLFYLIGYGKENFSFDVSKTFFLHEVSRLFIGLKKPV
jgi:hypothetical protein